MRRLWLIMLAIVGALDCAQAAAAQPVLLRPPLPAGAQGGQLNAVSCPTATACTAVGSYWDSAGAMRTLAEGWNGQNWVIQSTPLGPGPDSSLWGVSCSDRANCEAVGYSTASSISLNATMLAEHWNGSSWSIDTLPAPAGATYTFLLGVSCPSARFCTAVGAAHPLSTEGSPTVGAALIEVRDATRWATQSTPMPGKTGAALVSVSCSARDACGTVGYFVGDGGYPANFGERWNGTSWSGPERLGPTPSGRSLAAVSCPSAAVCTYVGEEVSYPGGGALTQPLAGTWIGVSWAPAHVPDPGLTYAELAGVSCSSPADCTAVGGFDYFGTDGNQDLATLAERWDGIVWSVQRTPPTGDRVSRLSGVSCPSRGDCLAVGSSNGNPVADRLG